MITYVKLSHPKMSTKRYEITHAERILRTPKTLWYLDEKDFIFQNDAIIKRANTGANNSTKEQDNPAPNERASK